jgi:hypothetical protein
MALSVKELLVVMMIAGLLFWLAKSAALKFTLPADFARRRRAWFALTIIAFLSPNFWVFVTLAIPILVVTAWKDSNPVAVYLMLLQVTPPIEQKIPMVFALDSFLLLSFCILTPAAVRILRTPDRPRYRNLIWIDLMLLGYGVFSSFHYLQVQSPSGELYPITVMDSLKRVFLFLIATYVPYFVASRLNANRRALVDSIATYCLACALLAGIASFESLRGWLLYSEMPARLSDTSGLAQYLMREQSLRAMASAGHPLTLATLLSIGVVLWLYLRPRVVSRRTRLGTSLLLAAGLFVTYSRGPWIGAATGYLIFVLIRPGGATRIMKTAVGVSLAALGLSLTPWGAKVMGLLPIFGGKADIGTLLYREALLNRSLAVIARHPLIGNTAAILDLQNLRQGQGIIDLVNVYVQVLLNGGIVGLTLLFGFLLLGTARANFVRRRLLQSDSDMARLGAALIACVVGLLVTLASGSLGTGTERMYYILGGFMAAYLAIAGAPPLTQKAELRPPASPNVPAKLGSPKDIALQHDRGHVQVHDRRRRRL